MEAAWIKNKNKMLPGKGYLNLSSHQNYYVSHSHVMVFGSRIFHVRPLPFLSTFCDFGQKTLSLVDKINVHEKRALLGS